MSGRKLWVHGYNWSVEMTAKENDPLETYWLDWRAVEITGHSAFGEEKRFYGELDKQHEDPEKAETAVEGYIKWDGCLEFTFADQPHYCGVDMAIAHMKELFELVHKAAREMSEPYECQSGEDLGKI